MEENELQTIRIPLGLARALRDKHFDDNWGNLNIEQIAVLILYEHLDGVAGE